MRLLQSATIVASLSIYSWQWQGITTGFWLHNSNIILSVLSLSEVKVLVFHLTVLLYNQVHELELHGTNWWMFQNSDCKSGAAGVTTNKQTGSGRFGSLSPPNVWHHYKNEFCMNLCLILNLTTWNVTNTMWHCISNNTNEVQWWLFYYMHLKITKESSSGRKFNCTHSTFYMTGIFKYINT